MLKLITIRCLLIAAMAAALAATGLALEGLWVWLVSSIALAVYIVTGGYYTLYLAWHTFPRDMRGAYRYVKLLLLITFYRCMNLTVPRVFRRTVERCPDRTALIFEDKRWTFLDLEDYSNRVAHFFLGLGYKPGDCIALFMENRPEYVGIWLGCAKIGIVPALINSNLTGKPLLHSINAASAIACVYGTEGAESIEEIKSECSDLRLYHSGPNKPTNGNRSHIPADSVNLDLELINSSTEVVPESVQKCTNFNDKLLYLYTSGTTGMPKAAVIKHSRFYFYPAGVHYMIGLSSIKNPVFYNPLPLYHSAGGTVGIGLMMVFGVTIVIRKKFSVRNFWKDCCDHNCNGAQYIGEICRYLLSAPETPEERQHQVEVMYGNGLRPQIWNEVVDRFGIKRVGEFYGATEGNSSVLNIDGVPGSVGFTSVLFPFVYPVRLIRVDEAGDVLRDKNGLCVLCQPGEPGEFVGKIVKNHPSRGFDGYVDKRATERKIVKNVLKKGDMWFRSGDLLSMDEFGWMYFVDRLGDTFRWKGENVSTMEVEAVLSGVLDQQDSIVYGVEIPGAEGRAGMAAIVEPEEGLDLKKFLQAVKHQLPSYAVPLFIRVVEKVDLTGTFKLKKLALQREGYNPHLVHDPIYFLDAAKGIYKPLDDQIYQEIQDQVIRI